jgi:(2Fe-2S) ferredoxin
MRKERFMEKPERHIFVCASFRQGGTAQGACAKKNSGALLPYLESELADRGLSGTSVTATGCLKACDRGPVMVIYPENVWYGGVESEKDVDAILDALAEGWPAKEYVLN